MVIIPGLAFDRQKNRLGRGKGFYDRFIKDLRIKQGLRSIHIALSFTDQIVDHVPVNKNDQPVDIIITDREFIY